MSSLLENRSKQFNTELIFFFHQFIIWSFVLPYGSLKLQKRFERLLTEYIVRKVKLTRSSLQFVSRGRQCNQSSCVAPSITNNDPGKRGNRMKLGGPFFFLNSKTRTAPRETEATGGFLKN